MQLDRTRIMIRERGFLDILELSLKVIRHHAGPLALAFWGSVIPLMFANHWLLTSVFGMDLSVPEEQSWYVGVLLGMMLWEAPFATAFITLYLGQAMFIEAPSLRRLTADFSRSLPQLVVFQGMLRGASIFACGVPVLLLYLIWPYLNEIILLERNGFDGTMNRLRVLHSKSSGLIVSRWLSAVSVGLVLIGSLTSSFTILREHLFDGQKAERWAFCVDLPLAIWIVLGLMTVARYLSYLDLRIRREGWEIELKMRAEAARLTRQLA